METKAKSATATEPSPTPPARRAPRRPRRFRKKTCFKKAPRGPWPVRALWQAASEEDQARAHLRCATMLEYWLGKLSKQEAAQRLQLPPLRIWQLSQQALAGMLAALVHQPRWREAGGAMTLRPDEKEELLALRKRVKELETELDTTRKVVELLKQFPPPATKSGPRATTTKKPERIPGGEKRRTPKKT